MTQLLAQIATQPANINLQQSGTDLQTVMSFYAGALTQIEWVVGSGLAIIAILVTIATWLWDRARVQRIQEYANKSVSEAKAQFQRSLDNAVSALKAEMNKELAATQAAVSYGQGDYFGQRNEYAFAAESFCESARKMMAAAHWWNLRAVLTAIMDCLKSMFKDDFAKAPALAQKCRDLVGELKKLDDKGAFKADADALAVALTQAESRQVRPSI